MAVFQKEKFTFKWQIQNFSMCPQIFQECIQSLVFVVEFHKNSEWQLQLFPKGKATENGIACYLVCRGLGGNPGRSIQIGFRLSIFPDGVKKSDEKENVTFTKDFQAGCPNFLSRDVIFSNKEAYLPNDTLTVSCSIWLSDGTNIDKNPATNELKNELLGTAMKSSFQDFGPMYECSAMTHVIVHKKSVTWPIRNFNSIRFNEILVKRVPSALRDMPSFFITFNKSIADQSVEIKIRREKTFYSKRIFVKCKISLLHAPKGIEYFTEDEHVFDDFNDSVWKLPTFIKLNELQEDGYFNGTLGDLYLRFEVFFSHTTSVYEMEKDFLPQFEAYFTAIKDFGRMLADGELSDATIRANGREFKVHKNILKARSPVFRAMFDNDMKEKKTGIVTINDIDPDTVGKMLAFMYTNAMEDVLAEDALKLYSLANEYQVLPLKFQCSCVLSSSLSVSNVCEVLTLADCCNDDYLRDCVDNFVSANSDEIFKSEDWKILMKDNLSAAARVMYKMLTN